MASYQSADKVNMLGIYRSDFWRSGRLIWRNFDTRRHHAGMVVVQEGRGSDLAFRVYPVSFVPKAQYTDFDIEYRASKSNTIIIDKRDVVAYTSTEFIL